MVDNSIEGQTHGSDILELPFRPPFIVQTFTYEISYCLELITYILLMHQSEEAQTDPPSLGYT